MSETNNLMLKFRGMAEELILLLTNLRDMTEEQLVQAVVYASSCERISFLARGMCVLELRRRNKERLTGGRGKRDLSGKGIQAQVSRFAEATGVDLSTLNTDARICETFFQRGCETTLARESLLAREFYVIALGAPDPHAAIQIAIKQCEDPHYRRERFRAYVRGLKRSENSINVSPEPLVPLRALLPADIHFLLLEIQEQTGKGKGEVLAQAITLLHHAIKDEKSSRSKAYPKTLKPQSASAQDSRQLTLGLQ